ncbi:ATP-binding protein [Flavobacterium rhizosphaerae]|uniref:histidine kinase n=1 Tax=Flavobacterium rhizosphaerae TaxID=3163298 RepID=A0ABW8YXV3_9FLAO
MRKIFTLGLFFLLLKVFAVSGPPSAFSVNASNPKYTTLPDSCYSFLDLGKRKFTLKEVIARGNTPFPESQDVFHVNIFNENYSWTWYRLKNTSSDAYTVALRANSSKSHIYVLDKGKWHSYKTGDKIAWSEKDGDKNKDYIPYKIEPGKEILVYSYDKGYYSPPAIGNFLKLTEESYLKSNVFKEEHVIVFGFAGFILFGMVFNLLFYYVSREKLYLVYSLLLFFSALTIADDAIGLLFFKENKTWYVYFQIFEAIGFIIMFVYTVRYFFSMKDYFPRWDKVFMYAAPIFIVVSFLFALILYLFRNDSGSIELKLIVLLIWGLTGIIMFLVVIAFFILLIWMLIIIAKRKDREARLFTIALIPFFASFIVNIFLSWQWLTQAAWIWTMIVLSWGLFARFKRLQEEYAKQALEKERIAREKEEEKNIIIAEQNVRLEKLVTERTADLEKSLNELKQTQDQLIQSEKMASLGELTAGIAHEIQNPLNFVNNFSDVSIELLDEMEEELDKGDTEEVKALAGDIKQNLEKIAHHGRRADGIVKGMLQHSRASTGQKEFTDINALADEYFRLAYHGLRAKDKSFNADLVTHFAENLPKISVVPQDVGRVLLNLFTNAFYATQQKAKQADAGSYKPVVEVSTSQQGSSIEIKVKDNGTGIPDAVRDKILQPFFTTKPTGEGTGLGLSLSYDIIVKGHGGTIEINSEEGVFSEFIIKLNVG